MRDSECVAFLQWALPTLHMRWQGFRKVRHQACKRIQHRIVELDLQSVADYRSYLMQNHNEWHNLDTLCRITISRFYRDRQVFSLLEKEVIPSLAQLAIARSEAYLKVWSAGCGSGEEPYTVALLWRLSLQQQFPGLDLHIVASDADPELIQRAQSALYQYASIKNLPEIWREEAFIREGDSFLLKPAFRHEVTFLVQDVRQEIPDEQFHLILCRNLVFTYFEEAQQHTWLEWIKDALVSNGVLVLGVHETLPEGITGFRPWSKRLCTYQKTE